MSKKRARAQKPMPDVVRIGTKRRIHPASPSAMPTVRKSAPKQDTKKTPESDTER